MAMSTAETLTSHLYSLSTPRPYSAAVEHPFLTAAGDGSLPPRRLAFWLAQDRLYAAHAYPRLIGRLIASLPLTSTVAPGSLEEQQNQRILCLLVYALQNVVREVNFFDEASVRWGLSVKGWPERKATRDYTAEMARVATEGTLFDGLVFVWAMEQVLAIRSRHSAVVLIFTAFPNLSDGLIQAYLDAWRYVGSVLERTGLASPADQQAVACFVANWTNSEFVKFVRDLADVVNTYGVRPGSQQWAKAEVIWARILELEEAFWPEEGEEMNVLSCGIGA